MPTDTFPISPSTNDGTAFWSRATYPPTTSTTTFGDEPGDTLFVTNGFFSPNYIIEETFLRFDTSTISSSATITAANLLLYALSKVDGANNKDLVGDYYDFGGEPVIEADGIEGASPSIFSAVDLAAITTSAVNTIALTDLTGVKRAGENNGQGFTGITGIRLTLTAGIPTVDNNVQFAAQEHANQEPRLEVTYTIPVASANLAWIRA